MTNQTIYTVGGTVQAGGGVYIPRKADDELLAHCRASEFAFILSSRQVGKSSLMVRTARQLESENIRSAIIDLSSIGVEISVDEWYLGILNIITEELELKTDIFAWWAERAALGPAQRLTNFFRDVLLKEVSKPVVLFFDEIDSTLSIPFADDFFAALRAIYNARSAVADFRRLSFVMIGVATPSDLIKDEKRTPFNIGYGVELTDFTPWEALSLVGDLGSEVLGWVFFWTSGHPYLTQRLCAYLSKSKKEVTEESVAEAVKQLFEGEQGKQDNNLQFVRDMLTKRAPDIQRVLKTYKDIRSGKKVSDDERSIPKAHLKISGVVRRENGKLRPRNRIYERTFDQAWVKENTPPTTTRRLVIASSLITIIALVLAGYFYYQQQNQTAEIQASTYINNFKTSNSQEVKITSLAELFRLGDVYATQARELFDALDDEQQLALFNLTTPANVGNELVVVTDGVYQNMENTTEGNALLKAMAEILRQTGSPDAIGLTLEINAWIDGREAEGREEYPLAISLYTRAFEYSHDRKNENAAILIDRAVAYTMVTQYAQALADYDNAVKIDTNSAHELEKAILGSQLLANYWRENSASYPNLSSVISIPTELPTQLAQLPTDSPTTTPTLTPASEPLAEIDSDGAVMVLVSAGEFQMGGVKGDLNAESHEKPSRAVYLDAYYIDRIEVTNELYKRCVDARGCDLPKQTYFFENSPRRIYYGNPEYDLYPVVYVDWNMAKNYCEWRGSRLPTEAEWEKAARGANALLYPWGDTEPTCLMVNYKEDCVHRTSKVGFYEMGKSPYGAYDMAGNVWEWVADWYRQDYYENSLPTNPSGPDSGQAKVLRGGSWSNAIDDIRTSERRRYPLNHNDNTLGFRCAQDLTP